MLTNENALASLETLTGGEAGALALFEGIFSTFPVLALTVKSALLWEMKYTERCNSHCVVRTWDCLYSEDRVFCVDSLASLHQRVVSLAVMQAGATISFATRVSNLCQMSCLPMCQHISFNGVVDGVRQSDLWEMGDETARFLFGY